MKYAEVAKGASEEEAKYLSQFKNESVLRKSIPLQRYQYTQFRSGAFVKSETRKAMEDFYRSHLEETKRIIASIQDEE